MIKTIVARLVTRLLPPSYIARRDLSGIAYWKQRADRYGERSVVNLAHPESSLPTVTAVQKACLLPILTAQLKGHESIALDLGCGPGRFTRDLATLLRGQAFGVDPIEHLIALAPSDPDVTYYVSEAGCIPLADDSVDLVWICLVLGGITDANYLVQTVAEVDRVLRPNGLVFLVENTAATPNNPHWHYRSVREYQDLFGQLQLRHLADYLDVQERISVMVGTQDG